MSRLISASLLILLAAIARAQTEKTAGSPASPTFALPAGSEITVPASRSEPLAVVLAWIAQNAPECPPAAAPEVAARFLEQVTRSHPADVERLGTPDFPLQPFEPLLWQSLAAQLTGPKYETARQTFAVHRALALLAARGRTAETKAAEAAIARLKTESAASYRRLAEGRMEDDDVLRIPGLDVAREAQRREMAAAPVKPKERTAADIVGEVSRRNQTGTAMLRLQAYVLEGELKTADGNVQRIVLSKMRPARARLVVLQGGVTQLILGVDADRFWILPPGQPLRFAPGKDLGDRRYLGEFTDPLLGGEGYTFERLPDGTEAGNSFYRIQIRRADGSGYVARIAADTFRQVGRELPDHTVARYSDFREVGGVTFIFREEVTDAEGRVGVLTVTRVSANPGLIEDYFTPPRDPGFNYYEVERQLTGAPAASAPIRTAQ